MFEFHAIICDEVKLKRTLGFIVVINNNKETIMYMSYV